MKLPQKWQANKPTHKPKRLGGRQKIPLELMGLAGSMEDQKAITMEEVRRQVVIMSSQGLEEALPLFPPTTNKKASEGTQHPKRRGRTKEIIAGDWIDRVGLGENFNCE